MFATKVFLKLRHRDEGRILVEKIIEVGLPVDETFCIRRNRLEAKNPNGKRISIVTGIHGDELEGQYVAYEVARILNEKPEHLLGTVDIYPAMNPLGIDTVNRGIPAFDLDMNRIFPGNNDGDMNEYVASKIIEALQGSDLVFDIHASNIYLTEIPQIRINELNRNELVPLAALANIDFIWVHSTSTVLESTLAYSLNMHKNPTPTLVVEMGVGMRITKEYGNRLTAGIFRLMKELGVWNGEVAEVSDPVISENPNDVAFLNAPVSGIFIKNLMCGSKVKKGDEIGKIVDPLTGTVLSPVLAPVDGWLFTIREYPVVDQGSLVGRILMNPKKYSEVK